MESIYLFRAADECNNANLRGQMRSYPMNSEFGRGVRTARKTSLREHFQAAETAEEYRYWSFD